MKKNRVYKKFLIDDDGTIIRIGLNYYLKYLPLLMAIIGVVCQCFIGVVPYLSIAGWIISSLSLIWGVIWVPSVGSHENDKRSRIIGVWTIVLSILTLLSFPFLLIKYWQQRFYFEYGRNNSPKRKVSKLWKRGVFKR